MAFNELECYSRPAECNGVISQMAGKEPTLDIRRNRGLPGRELRACTLRSILVKGISPHLVYLGLGNSTDAAPACCARVIADSDDLHQRSPLEIQRYKDWVSRLSSKVQRQELLIDSDVDINKVDLHLKDFLGVDYLRERVQRRIGNDAKPLAWYLQAYNGYGKYGVAEKDMENSCLSGIDFNEKPVYGAVVGDILVNMLMPNPVVEKMVRASSVSQGRTPESILCIGKKAGKYSMDPLYFPRQQAELLTRDSSERRSSCTQGSPPITFEPWRSRAEALSVRQ